MKPLALLLIISSLSSALRAQEFKLQLEKTTNKYGLKLKKDNPAIPFLKSPNDLSLKTRGIQSNQRLDSITINRLVYPRTRGNMSLVIPDTRNIARMPNALPYFSIPEVAAIPNPLLRNEKRMHHSPSFN